MVILHTHQNECRQYHLTKLQIQFIKCHKQIHLEMNTRAAFASNQHELNKVELVMTKIRNSLHFLLLVHDARSSFRWYGWTLIPAWKSNYNHYKVWYELTYPFPNFNGAAIEIWEWINNFILHFTGHVITNLCWHLSLSVQVKGTAGDCNNHNIHSNCIMKQTENYEM